MVTLKNKTISHHVVEGFDGLVNLSLLVIVESVPEPLTPMTKIGRYDKERRGVVQIFCKDLTVLDLPFRGEGADQNRHNCKISLALHEAGDVGQVHLNAVLLLVCVDGHDFEVASGHQLFVHPPIHGQVVEGSGIF